jgi:hypothetical protein
MPPWLVGEIKFKPIGLYWNYTTEMWKKYGGNVK